MIQRDLADLLEAPRHTCHSRYRADLPFIIDIVKRSVVLDYLSLSFYQYTSCC